jgi:ABC-type sugar transport system substrate-binding protein
MKPRRGARSALSPCDSKAIGPVIREANAAGIPVLTVERDRGLEASPAGDAGPVDLTTFASITVLGRSAYGMFGQSAAGVGARTGCRGLGKRRHEDIPEGVCI